MRECRKAWFVLMATVVALALVVAHHPTALAQEKAAAPAKVTVKEAGRVPFVPTPIEVVQEMLKLCDIKPTDVVFDPGCGDGRIVVEAVKTYGCRGFGVDIDPERVSEARARAKENGVADKVTILQGDLLTTRFSSATVIAMYLLPRYNALLRPRLIRMPVGTRIVSHAFDMEYDLPEEQKSIWKPQLTKEVTTTEGGSYTVYFWKITEEMKKAAGVPLKGQPGAKKRARKAAP